MQSNYFTMSIHIGARSNDIAEIVLLSGDPLRAKFVAENLLENTQCYTEVRNMLGFTGLYQDKKISVQGTGMGQASIAIYVNELVQTYGAKTLVRIGTCGALDPSIKLGEIIVAQGASTDSNFNRLTFNGLDFAPLGDFVLLYKTYQKSKELGVPIRVGNVFSTDSFYSPDDPHRWQIWQEHSILCTDMETAMLYTLAAKAGLSALSILTVSDNIVTGDLSRADEREKAFMDMVKLALEVVT